MKKKKLAKSSSVPGNLKKVRMTDEERLEQFQAYVKLCFIAIEDRGFSTKQQLYEALDITAGTLDRLLAGPSLRTHIRTLDKLSELAGFALLLTEDDVDFKVLQAA